MNHWENMKPISGTFEATGDFTDWLNELKKSSIVEIDIIGLHDKTTGEKREFVAFDKVLEMIDSLVRESNITIDNYNDVAIPSKALKAAVTALKEGEQE